MVRYKTVTFDAFFLGHESPWTRGTKEEKDALWESTYECEFLLLPPPVDLSLTKCTADGF